MVTSEISPPLIFVWIGKKLPNWAHLALELTVRQSKVEVMLLCQRSIEIAIAGLTVFRIEEFYKPLNNIWMDNIDEISASYRDGFWIKTTERFLVLNMFVKFRALEKFFHAELDNLIFDLTGLSDRLDHLGAGFFCPRDQCDRGIASLIYINDIEALKALTKIIYSGSIRFENDMKLLGYLLNHDDRFYSLPGEWTFNNAASPKWAAVSPLSTGGLFDAAALGQYILGIDPRSCGVILKNGDDKIIVNAGCMLANLVFHYNEVISEFKISDRVTGGEFKIYNLHIHSKLFRKVIKINEFKKILERLNNHKKTVLLMSPQRNRLFRSIGYRWFGW
jgi:hypothetical protein